MKIIILLLLLCSNSFSADYLKELSRLEKRSHKIDQKLKTLGIVPFEQIQNFSKEESKNTNSIIALHSDLTFIKAQAGKFLFGKTLNRLIVGPEGSPAVIELDLDQGIFSSLRLLGKATQNSTQDRVFLVLDRLILKTASPYPIKAVALDEQGGYGLTAQVFSSKALKIAGAMAGSFISGYAASQQTQSPSNAFGFSQPETGSKNGILQGVSQTAADQSKRLIEESTEEKPVLVVNAATALAVLIEEEVRF